MDNFESCPGYKILSEKFEMSQKHMDDRFDALLKHSDEQDDIIEKKVDELADKVDKIDDFLRNGFTDKVLKTITDYFDKIIATIVKWIFRIGISGAVLTAAGLIINAIFF